MTTANTRASLRHTGNKNETYQWYTGVKMKANPDITNQHKMPLHSLGNEIAQLLLTG